MRHELQVVLPARWGRIPFTYLCTTVHIADLDRDGLGAKTLSFFFFFLTQQLLIQY